MNLPIALRLAALAPILLVKLPSMGQGDPDVVARIVDEGKNHSQILNQLHHLCFDIGARLTGSPDLAKADRWAVEQFKKFGCTNVHLEKWGSFPVGFDRGPRQFCRMIEPTVAEMQFTTPDWTNGTSGPERGEATKLPESLAALESIAWRIKGKWLVVPPREIVPVSVMKTLERAGALGCISGSHNDLVITSGEYDTSTFERHPGLPQIKVRRSDYEKIVKGLDSGQRVELEIDAENRWYKGPIPCYNLVADIRGVEKPDEMVIVGGHLDSWDGPGSQGAQDNGVGSMAALEAARILCAAGARPKRTIRFVLWSGEEQGLLGSVAYVRTHRSELGKISAVLVDDGGGDYQGGYSILPQMEPMMRQAIAPSQAAFPTMPQELRIVTATRMPRGGASDHAPFNAVGVPGLFTIKTGVLDYDLVHHTQNDRFDTCRPDYLVQCATNHALVSYNLACADTLLPRERKP